VKNVGLWRTAICAALISAVLLATTGVASAYNFKRTLRKGDSGRDVMALQVRMAGWFPHDDQTHFSIDREFGQATKEAVIAFQRFYGLKPDGVAGDDVFKELKRLQDEDGSTVHFEWSEFTQHRSSSCSAGANAYAGSFGGGMVSPHRAKRNVRRLMWRLEAVRAKAGGQPVGINSGFRSVPYNDCIGGARASQHTYGTAADNRVAGISNERARVLAKGSQMHGIGCYSKLSHNHFDLRIDNEDLGSQRGWWWPRKDSRGRDLDEAGRPCWGAGGHRKVTGATASFDAIRRAVPGAGSLIPSAAEIAIFEAAGEVADLGLAD
jgi:zinc D-Ala-D-Ala carboxypeptidase